MSQESGIAAARFSRLDSIGQPLADGENGAYVVCDITSGETTYNFETGNEVIKKDGLGNICFNRKRPDQIKSLSEKVTLCGITPEALEMIVNGPVTLLGGVTPTGWALSTVSCGSGVVTDRGGVFYERWVGNYNCGTQDPTNPWIRKWSSRVWLNYEGGTNDEGAKDVVFSGEGVTSVVNTTAATADHGGPFQDITDLTLDAPYLYGEQYDADLPADCGDYADTAFVAP